MMRAGTLNHRDRGSQEVRGGEQGHMLQRWQGEQSLKEGNWIFPFMSLVVKSTFSEEGWAHPPCYREVKRGYWERNGEPAVHQLPQRKARTRLVIRG